MNLISACLALYEITALNIYYCFTSSLHLYCGLCHYWQSLL